MSTRCVNFEAMKWAELESDEFRSLLFKQGLERCLWMAFKKDSDSGWEIDQIRLFKAFCFQNENFPAILCEFYVNNAILYYIQMLTLIEKSVNEKIWELVVPCMFKT